MTAAGERERWIDREPRTSASINDVTVTEGHTGTVNATFTVSLSAAFDAPVTD